MLNKILAYLSAYLVASFRIFSFKYSSIVADTNQVLSASKISCVAIGKCLILFRFLLIFTLVTLSPLIKGAQQLLKLDQENYQIALDYDATEELIRLKVKNDALSKSMNWGGPYSVASPDAIDATLEQIKNFLSTFRIEANDIERVVNRVAEFKYISRVNCGALHFSVENAIKADQGRIDSLLGEIVKIANFKREDLIPSRSLLVDTFSIGEEQKIQLRMVLDQNGDFMSFSFAKETGTMEGYKWYTKGNSVYLKNLRGDVVLSIDLENFNHSGNSSAEGGLILVKGPKEKSIENEERTYIRLSSSPESEWKIDKYDTQHFRGNVAKNGVALSSSFAKHTPIVQLQGSDVYFPKIDTDKLFDRFKYSGFKNLNITQIEDSYNECMGERTSLAQEQINFGHADINIVESDNINFCERLSLLDQNKYRDNLTYRSCLLDEDTLLTEEGFEYLNFSFLSQISDDKFEEIVRKCQSRSDNTNTRSKVLQSIEEVELNLSTSEGTRFEQDLEACFSKLGAMECEEQAMKWVGNLAMIKFLEVKSGVRSNCSFSLISEDQNLEFTSCFDNTVEEALDGYKIDFFREGAHSFGSSIETYSESDFNSARIKFKACMIEQLEAQDSLLDQKEKWFQFEQYCLTESLKIKTKAVFKTQAAEKVDELIGWIEDDDIKSNLISSLNIEINNIIESAKTLSSYNDIKDEIALKVYSILSSHYLMNKLNAINEDSFSDTVQSFLLGGGESSDSMMPSMRLSLRSIERRVSSQVERLPVRDRLTYVKNLIKTTEINALNLNKDKSVLLERTYEDRLECLNDLSVAQNSIFSEEMKVCIQEGHADLVLEDSRIQFEKEVASHFLVESERSNQLLSLLTELKSCLKKYTSREYYSNNKYVELMKGCKTYAHLQLRQDISREKLKSYRPIVDNYWDEFDKCSQNITSSVRSEYSSLPREYSLLEMNSLNSIEEREGILIEVGKNRDKYSLDINRCEEELDKAIVRGVKDYFISKVPSLSGLADTDKNESVLANFFDEELISQILKFHKINDAKNNGNAIDLGALVSDERVVTSDFGVSSLTNFLDTLGSFFDKGFIYDEGAMRTEVVVFKSELKDFLRWYNSNPNEVSVREAKEFFGQSQLGEHLALAVVSEQVYTKFTSGINTMRGEEVRDFFSKTSCKTYWSCFEKNEGNSELRERYDSMISKYDNLLELTKTMTSSYDFRRIIRPDTIEGERIIEKAHEAVLAPAVLGVQASATAQEDLMESLGAAILADNTDGGFSERFVEEVVTHSLKEEESSRSALGKWLFYDQGDFDWNKLRKTKSGQEALNYYARFIMLPRMLGQEQKRYMRNLRQTQFEKLMRQAQSENEH